MKTIELYTDGACAGNPGPGGWCALLRWVRAGQPPVEKVLSGGAAGSTNNRMELTALIYGLEALKEPCVVTVYSDSRYVLGLLEGSRARANLDLVERLRKALEPHTVSGVKVAAHTGDLHNERVDAEARRQAERQREMAA